MRQLELLPTNCLSRPQLSPTNIEIVDVSVRLTMTFMGADAYQCEFLIRHYEM